MASRPKSRSSLALSSFVPPHSISSGSVFCCVVLRRAISGAQVWACGKLVDTLALSIFVQVHSPYRRKLLARARSVLLRTNLTRSPVAWNCFSLAPAPPATPATAQDERCTRMLLEVTDSPARTHTAWLAGTTRAAFEAMHGRSLILPTAASRDRRNTRHDYAKHTNVPTEETKKGEGGECQTRSGGPVLSSVGVPQRRNSVQHLPSVLSGPSSSTVTSTSGLVS